MIQKSVVEEKWFGSTMSQGHGKVGQVYLLPVIHEDTYKNGKKNVKSKFNVNTKNSRLCQDCIWTH